MDEVIAQLESHFISVLSVTSRKNLGFLLIALTGTVRPIWLCVLGVLGGGKFDVSRVKNIVHGFAPVIENMAELAFDPKGVSQGAERQGVLTANFR